MITPHPTPRGLPECRRRGGTPPKATAGSPGDRKAPGCPHVTPGHPPHGPTGPWATKDIPMRPWTTRDVPGSPRMSLEVAPEGSWPPKRCPQCPRGPSRMSPQVPGPSPPLQVAPSYVTMPPSGPWATRDGLEEVPGAVPSAWSGPIPRPKGPKSPSRTFPEVPWRWPFLLEPSRHPHDEGWGTPLDVG